MHPEDVIKGVWPEVEKVYRDDVRDQWILEKAGPQYAVIPCQDLWGFMGESALSWSDTPPDHMMDEMVEDTG